MVIRVYVSGISGNKEVKKRQQRVLMILESKNIPCEIIDITEPGKESDKEFMQQNSKPRGDQKHPLPPQIFNDDEYCGDFLGFDLSNENEKLLPFLKMAVPEPSPPPQPKEESDDENKKGSETESEEEEEELKPTRPRPRPPPKVVAEDDSNANAGGDDEDANKNLNAEESSENNEDKRQEGNIDEMLSSEDNMAVPENEEHTDETDGSGSELPVPVAQTDNDNEEADTENAVFEEDKIGEEQEEDAAMEVSEE